MQQQAQLHMERQLAKTRQVEEAERLARQQEEEDQLRARIEAQTEPYPDSNTFALMAPPPDPRNP